MKSTTITIVAIYFGMASTLATAETLLDYVNVVGNDNSYNLNAMTNNVYGTNNYAYIKQGSNTSRKLDFYRSGEYGITTGFTSQNIGIEAFKAEKDFEVKIFLGSEEYNFHCESVGLVCEKRALK